LGEAAIATTLEGAMLKRLLLAGSISALCSSAAIAGGSWGGGPASACPNLPGLKSALQQAIGQAGGKLGLGLNMWATIVAPDGRVCAVVYSSDSAIQGQWLASRVISAQKAFTAATLSLQATSNSGSGGQFPNGKLALSTANLYSAVQPGGSLFGLQHSNPVFAPGAYGDVIVTGGGGVQTAAYSQGEQNVATFAGPPQTSTYGTSNDPMIGLIVGGINVFGGGLALYAQGDVKVGGVGVSGDTSCTDHLIAWNLRHNLGLDHLGSIGGVSGDSARPDNIVFDIANGQSAGGFGHPTCGGASNGSASTIAKGLPAVLP
jgi:uncharacterized protein GlcG (DUF336 family)